MGSKLEVLAHYLLRTVGLGEHFKISIKCGGASAESVRCCLFPLGPGLPSSRFP